MDAERTLQIRMGVFTLIVLVALAAVVSSLNREAGLFTARYTLYADFDNIEGLFANAPVRLAGNHVGRVRDIAFLPPGSSRALRVELDIDASVQDRIRGDSLASVHTAGLLGDMYIEITLGGEKAEPLVDGGMVASRDPLSFNELADKGAELLANLVAFSASAERIVGSFEDAMGTESIASTFGSLANIVNEIETGDGMLHALVYDESGDASADLAGAISELRGSLQRLNVILSQVEDGDGLLHDFIYGADDTDRSTLGRHAQRDGAARERAAQDRRRRGVVRCTGERSDHLRGLEDPPVGGQGELATAQPDRIRAQRRGRSPLADQVGGQRGTRFRARAASGASTPGATRRG